MRSAATVMLIAALLVPNMSLAVGQTIRNHQGTPPKAQSATVPNLSAGRRHATYVELERRIGDRSASFPMRLSAAALERTRHAVLYDPAYVRIPYPMGDVNPRTGVCTDEVIRPYRRLGIDLQRLVHEDMRAAFHQYPKRWGLISPDRNIDHRRVPNLAVFFARHGQRLQISKLGLDYQPGEIVTWTLPGNLPHIGIVTERRSRDGKRPLIVHNIGGGPILQDMLFAYPISGRFTYDGTRTR